MVLAASSFDEQVAIVFIDIAIIMVVARLMGALFKRIRQPAVVGEILAGIMLGPTLLGAFPGDLPDRIFPPGEVREYLGVIAQLGLIIFMFIVGLELDMKLIKGKERVAGVISLTSVVLPFVLGIAGAFVLHGAHDEAPNAGDFWPFALFIGASMSVTAFPVLARILTDRGMNRTPIGALALACAAVDDILAWSLLAVVVAAVESAGVWDLPRILVLSVVFVSFMFAVVKPQLAKLTEAHRRAGRLTPGILSVVLIGVFVSSYITSEIGIHSIFGAFLFGVIMPREDAHELFREILERLEQVSVLVLLPVFFIATGLGVDVGGLSAQNLGELALILVIACAGKFLGATIGARSQGIELRKASAIGILMNTRGLTELVILNIGLSKGVLDDELFTILVVMAVVTTIITEPLLRLVYSDKVLAKDIADAERAALGIPNAFRVLTVLDDGPEPERLVDTALDLVGDEDPAEVVLTRFRPFGSAGLEVGSGLVEQLGDMSSSLASTNALAERARQRGTSCVVLSQLSNDMARDVLAQAISTETDLVLVERRPDDDSAAFVTALLAQADREVGIVVSEPPPDGSVGSVGGEVAGRMGDGADDDAAVEVAIRVARTRDVGLVLLVDGASRRATRRAASLVDHLTAHLPCRIAEGPMADALGAGASGGAEPVGLLVTAATDPVPDDGAATAGSNGKRAATRATLRVWAASDRSPDHLTRFIEALDEGTTRAPASTSFAPEGVDPC